MVLVRSPRALEFACYTKACAPPPAGKGGSSKNGIRIGPRHLNHVSKKTRKLLGVPEMTKAQKKAHKKDAKLAMKVMAYAFAARSFEFACHSSACRPPTSGGTGGSSGNTDARRAASPGYGPKALSDVRLGGVRVTYKPDYPDDGPDPGEIVWARVPFQDDPSQSKDRPVLVLGRIDGTDKLAAVQLTTQLRPGDKAQFNVGAGSWDKHNRPSAIKLDRIIQIDASNYRREGAVVSRSGFESVVGRVSAYHRTPVTVES